MALRAPRARARARTGLGADAASGAGLLTSGHRSGAPGWRLPAGLSVFTFFWILFVVPETKGYTLEEIEANLARGGRHNWIPPKGRQPLN